MTITLSARDLAGYETLYYAVEGSKGGKVRLRFASAEVTKDDKTTAETQPAALPFPLPAKPQHLRLLFLIRSSRSDHNMAILGAHDQRSLVAFTDRLKEDPDACRASRAVFCAWVPAGIAVRPQEPGER